MYLGYLTETPEMFSTVIKQKVIFMLQDLRGKDIHNFNVYYLTKDVSNFGMLPKNIRFALAKLNYIPKRLTVSVWKQRIGKQIFFLLAHLR